MIHSQLNLMVGTMVALAGALVLIRVMLLEPASVRYPKAPTWLRNLMLCFAAVLLFVGFQFVFSETPPQPATRLMALSLLLYKTAMLGNVIRQRYPEQVWRRLNRIDEVLHCKSPASRWFSK